MLHAICKETPCKGKAEKEKAASPEQDLKAQDGIILLKLNRLRV